MREGGGVEQGSIRKAVHCRWRGGPPPPQTKVTIVGKNEIYRWKIWLGHFKYTNFWVPDPPPPLSPPLLILLWG